MEQNQKGFISNNCNFKSQDKTTTPRKVVRQSKDISEIVTMLDSTLSSKQISDRIARSHREANSQIRIQNSQPNIYFKTTNAEKQRLFAEREKFRQNYRN